MNARFTEFVNGSPVRITLRPGQSLAWYSGRKATEEGWTSLAMMWHHHEDMVRCEVTSDGRDCDGRLTNYSDSWCMVDRLSAIPADEYGPARPDWQPGNSVQRDEYAEADGY